MSILQKMGISKNSPSEVLLTSFNSKKDPHAAAVGVYLLNEKKVKMNLFGDTRTYKNLSNSGGAVANIVSNPELIIKGGLPDIFSPPLKTFSFETAKKVNAPYLSKADAFLEFEIKEMKGKTLNDDIGFSKYFETIGSVKNIEILNDNPHTLKRSDFYLIESSVLASKAISARKKGKKEKFNDLVDEISFFKQKSQKIAPKSRTSNLILDILDHLDGKTNE